MKITSCAHVHAQFSDARSTAEEMVQAALAAGFAALGFSEHARQNFDPDYSMSAAGEKAYLAEFARLKAKYAGQIVLHLGVEQDAFACPLDQPYEYVIGSVHYLPDAKGGYVAVDGDMQTLDRWIRSAFCGDQLAFARAYYNEVVAFITGSRPAIIGHINLLEKYNERMHWFDSASADYRNIVDATLAALRPTGAILEVNTGGMARAGLKTPYPDLRTLGVWRELGGRVMVNSDCHFAPQIDFWFAPCVDYLKRAGFRSVMQLSARAGELFEEVPLT